jgi:DNA modification methylase
LRSYDTAKWIGGDPACDHQAPIEGGKSGNKGQYQRHAGRFAGPACYRCGAQRIDRQIGLEESPDAYVAALVAAFAEVHRVLRDDGVLWVNIASSYCNAGSRNNGTGLDGKRRGGMSDTDGSWSGAAKSYGDQRHRLRDHGIKHKDLIYIPAMLALELQKWGWYLRSDVIWSKRNAMPSPVQDRPSMSHEYVFLLTKKARYFYDGEAVKEPNTDGTIRRLDSGSVQSIADQPKQLHRNSGMTGGYHEANGRNCRSVWTFNVASFPGSHYAVMAPDLAECCIRAGTSQAGCCPKCGAPYRRVIEKTGETNRRERKDVGDFFPEKGSNPSGIRSLSGATYKRQRRATDGWTPGCKCDAGEPMPCRVFDPFGGVATTALVAVGLGRDGIACDLSAKYLEMGKRRIERPHAPVRRAPSPNRPEKPTPLFKDDE